MSRLGDASVAYQQQLETARIPDWDDEHRELLVEDLRKARREFEIAWLEEQLTA